MLVIAGAFFCDHSKKNLLFLSGTNTNLQRFQMIDYKDFTIKAVLKEKACAEQVLVELGAKFEGEDFQHDYYFKTSTGKLKFRKSTSELLIAHYERVVINNFEKTIVHRYDINPSDLEIKQLFDSNEIIGETRKIRKLYYFKNVAVHLDKLSNGKEFIEVEAKDFDNSYTELELQEQCLFVFKKLDISKSDIVRTGYLNH